MPLQQNQVQKYKCPCGKSYFTVNSYHDENGLFDEHWQMGCPHCEQLYQLNTHVMEKDGQLQEAYLWTPISLFSELTITESQLHKVQADALLLAREMYLEKWMLYFSGARTKNDIWSRLTDDGKREPSYEVFDEFVNRKNLSEYLQNYFQHHNLDYILKKLNIQDIRLQYMNHRAESIRQKTEKLKNMLRLEGFHHKINYDLGK